MSRKNGPRSGRSRGQGEVLSEEEEQQETTEGTNMDTTAKVDIRKLQLLNDRIAQTIDALNQVRLSVHGLGLSHTGGNIPNVGLGAFGVTPQAWGGQTGWGQSAFGGWGGQGLGHTSPYAYPQAGYAPFLQNQVNPLLAHLYGQQVFGGGLSHTSPEQLGAIGALGNVGAAYGAGYGVDPFTVARLMHAFPYAQLPISPLG
jgi:hypothetical protein